MEHGFGLRATIEICDLVNVFYSTNVVFSYFTQKTSLLFGKKTVYCYVVGTLAPSLLSPLLFSLPSPLDLPYLFPSSTLFSLPSILVFPLLSPPLSPPFAPPAPLPRPLPHLYKMYAPSFFTISSSFRYLNFVVVFLRLLVLTRCYLYD